VNFPVNVSISIHCILWYPQAEATILLIARAITIILLVTNNAAVHKAYAASLPPISMSII